MTMSNSSKAIFYDGNKPIPIEGWVCVYSDFLVFKESIENKNSGTQIKFENIISVQKNVDDFYITITENNNKSSQKLIIKDLNFYLMIMERWRTNKKNFFTKIAIAFQLFNLKKKVFVVLSLIPVAILIMYLVLYQSYHFVDPVVDIKIGDFVSEKIINEYTECSNKKSAALLNEMSKLLVPENSNYNYKIFVVKNKMPNAFALPNGHIFIFSQLLEDADNPEEIAFVLAHEVSHVERRHGIQKMIRVLGAAFVIKSVIGAGFEEAEFAELASEIINLVLFFKYSQDFEQKADLDAVTYLHNKRITAKGSLSFFEKMNQLEIMPEGLSWLSTHPSNKERVDYLKKEVEIEEVSRNSLLRYKKKWRQMKSCN